MAATPAPCPEGKILIFKIPATVEGGASEELNRQVLSISLEACVKVRAISYTCVIHPVYMYTVHYIIVIHSPDVHVTIVNMHTAGALYIQCTCIIHIRPY